MKIRVYKGQYGWSTICKNKLQNGTEVKYYLPVNFYKNSEPMADKANIVVKNGWFKAYHDKNNIAKPSLFIMEYEEVISDDHEEFQSEKSSEINLNAEDLPFY